MVQRREGAVVFSARTSWRDKIDAIIDLRSRRTALQDLPTPATVSQRPDKTLACGG